MKLTQWLRQDWSGIIRMLTVIMVAILLIIGIVAYRHTQATTNALLNKVASLSQQNVDLAKEVKSDTDSIHQQATCIFLFFQQPQADRNTTSVTYPPECVTSTPGSFSPPITILSPASTPSPQTSPSRSRSSEQGNPNPGRPSPPSHPLICTLTLKLIGCKG